jgi:hypothetical protein
VSVLCIGERNQQQHQNKYFHFTVLHLSSWNTPEFVPLRYRVAAGNSLESSEISLKKF